MTHNSDMIKLVRLLEGKQEFAGEEVGQKPGDQVRGTDKAKTSGKDHPFKGRLVGEDTTLEDVLSKKYQDFKDIQAKEKSKKKEKEELDEISLGDYRHKAGMQKALAGMGAMFGRSPEERAQELAKFKKRERGLERVKARDERARKADQEKRMADSIARLPELKAEYEEMVKQYKALGGSNWQYADRDQNLTDSERKARAMEGPMNHLWREIQAAEKAQKDRDIEEAFIAPGLSAANAAAEFKRQGQAGGGYKGRIDIPVSSVEDYQEAGRTLKRAAAAKKQHIEYGLSGRTMSVFSDSMDTDELDAFIDDALIGGLDEGYLDRPGEESSPVTQAITRRILLQRTDLLAKYGPEKVAAAIDDVADFVGDVEEIGSSDVSGWVRHVEQILGNSVDEAAPALVKGAAGLALGGLAAAGAPAIVGILGPLLGIPFAAYSAYSAAKLGIQGVEKLWDMAAEKLGGEDKVTQYTSAKIAKLPPDQAKAAAATVKQLGENKKKKNAGQLLGELGADPKPAPAGTATAAPATANATPTSGSVSPDEQAALNKIQTNPAMKQQLDKLMTQATPGAANKPMELNPEQEDALEKIKANAGLKTQYDKIIKQANPQAKV